jgi:hypothetical protein
MSIPPLGMANSTCRPFIDKKARSRSRDSPPTGLSAILCYLSSLWQDHLTWEGWLNRLATPLPRTALIASENSMSLEAVSRAFRSSSVQGIIKYRNRRHLKFLNRAAFEGIPG